MFAKGKVEVGSWLRFKVRGSGLIGFNPKLKTGLGLRVWGSGLRV